MRWERLFEDLEAQAEAAERAELDAEVAERSRFEVGRLRLADRLRPAVGRQLRLTCRGAGALTGELVRLGTGWLLLTESAHRDVLVAVDAVTSISGLPARSAPAPNESGAKARIAARLDLRAALRGLGRDRAGVQAMLVDGERVSGTIDRVGADFVELAEHPQGEVRRPAAVLGVRTIPLPAIACVRTLS